MTWPSLLARGILSGVLIVSASELAKRSALCGALLISIPFMSILSIIWLYSDTKDTEHVPGYAEGILWLIFPSMCLFILLPYLLRRGWSLESSLALGIVVTVCMYALSAAFATSVVGVEA